MRLSLFIASSLAFFAGVVQASPKSNEPTKATKSTIINNSNTNYFASSSRPLLIFKHNPKAGGGSIEEVLLELKQNYISNEDAFPDFNNKKTNNHAAISPNNNLTTTLLANKKDHTLIVVHESQSVGMLHRQEGFVISSIREPCDHYVSLWAFGSGGHGGLHRRSEKRNYNWTLAAYGHDSPAFDSKEDIKRFQQLWLPDPNIRGLIAERFREGYGRPKIIEMANGSTISSTPDSVDCWVYVDDFKATLYTCLREYEMQGGLVDWDAPLLSALVKKLQETNAKRKLEGHSKNDPIGNPQLFHHSKCTTYYDNVTADIVELGEESYIFKAFGYQGCCGGRKPKNTLIHPPPLKSSPEVNGFDGLEQNQTQENFTFGYLPSESLIAVVCALGIFLILVLVRRLQKQRAGHHHRYAAAKQDDAAQHKVEGAVQEEVETGCPGADEYNDYELDPDSTNKHP